MSLEELMDIEIIPIGILESHIHVDGAWMVGYQYIRKNMSGTAPANADHMMYPESMWMDMSHGDVDVWSYGRSCPYGDGALSALVRQSEIVNAGAHAEGKWSVGRNRNDYRLGDRYHAGCVAHGEAFELVCPDPPSARRTSRAISGADPEIAAGMSPANDPKSYEDTYLSLAPGVTISSRVLQLATIV